MENLQLRTTPEFVRNKARHYILVHFVVFMISLALGLSLLMALQNRRLMVIGVFSLLIAFAMLCGILGDLETMLRCEGLAKCKFYLDKSQFAVCDGRKWAQIPLRDIESVKVRRFGGQFLVYMRRRPWRLQRQKEFDSACFDRQELTAFVKSVRQAVKDQQEK